MEFSITIHPDEEGYTGRECPKCEKYFKIIFGTGLSEVTDCHCPYCNHIDPQDEFLTKQQFEYAHSVALHKMSGDFLKEMKKMEIRPNRNEIISLGITVEGRPTPIAYYSETELEERVTCSSCTLQYTIYGLFGYCPDCGVHNSQQIVNANFDLVLRVLDLSSDKEKEIKQKMVENALEDAISTFDGFGREHCSNLNYKISFQSIEVAKNKLLSEEGIDIKSGLGAEEWKFVGDQFQKRHLIAHQMGIIDENYVQKTNNLPSLIGRKVSITECDVRNLVSNLRVIASNLFNGIGRN